MDLSYKKRYRVPASCSVCRKRKSKCDRVKPVCGSCKKKSIAHLCYYEDGPPSTGYVHQLGEHILPVPAQGEQLLHEHQYQHGVPSQHEGPLQQHLPPPPVAHSGQVSSHQVLPQMLPSPFRDQQRPQQQEYSPLPAPIMTPQFQTLQQQRPLVGNGASHGPAAAHAAPLQHVHSPHKLHSTSQKNPPIHLQRHSVSSLISEDTPPYRMFDSPQESLTNSTGGFSNSPPVNPTNTANLAALNAASSAPAVDKHGQNGRLTFSSSHSRAASQVSVSSAPAIPMAAMHQSQPAVHPAHHHSVTVEIPHTSLDTPMNKSSSDATMAGSELIPITIGPNATLLVDPNDRINLFANASFSLNLEGPFWQQQGTLSYMGLTKSDPFIKVLRSYAILLFKSGEMASYIRNETMKRKKTEINGHSTTMSGSSTNASTTGTPSYKRHRYASPPKSTPSDMGDTESKKDVDDEPGDVVEEDALIVDRIKVADEEEEEEEEEEASGEEYPEESTAVPEPESITKPESRMGNSDVQSPGSTTSSCKRRKSKADLVPHIIRLDSSRHGKDAHFEIVKRVILQILPNKLNMFMLFCRFFKYVHPFVPVVDENSLMIDLNKLFGHFPYFERTSYEDISIESEHDISSIGILLIVIRLGYMSLIHTDEANNQYSEDEKSIIRDVKRTHSETFVRALKLCIDDRALGSRSTFKLVQVLTLYYFYRQMAPDDSHGLGGSDAQVLFGVILTHAKSIGLHRDPKYYVAHESISKRESLKKTWRSLWFYLTVMDARSAIQSGIPPYLQNLDTCDVELPSRPNDKQYNDMVNVLHTLCESYRHIANMIGNVVNKPKIMDILVETNKLEKLFSDLFGKDFFRDTICKPTKVPSDPAGFDANSREHEESFLKVFKYLKFVNLRTNLNCMYYMIAMHYENGHIGSSTMNSGIELFKIFCKSVFQLVFVMSYVLDNSVDVFGRNYDYLIASYNERCMIKTHNFLTSLFVRLLHHKKDCTTRSMAGDPVYKQRLEVVDSLFSIVLIEAELFVGNFRKLSVNYINSYKLYVMTYFVLKQCMENPSVLFEKINDSRFFHEGTNMFDFFTIQELKYLGKSIEEFRTAKEEQARLKEARTNAEVAKSAAKSGLLRKTMAQPFNLPFPDSYSQSQLYASSEATSGGASAGSSNGSLGSAPAFSSENSPVFGIRRTSRADNVASGDQEMNAHSTPTANSTPTPLANYSSQSTTAPTSNTDFPQQVGGIFEDTEDVGGDDLLRLFAVYGELDPSELY